MSILLKNFGPYSKLRTAKWPIAWRKQTQSYNNDSSNTHAHDQVVIRDNNKENLASFLETLKKLTGPPLMVIVTPKTRTIAL